MSQMPRMIERRVVYGVREDVKDGVHYLDDNNIVWVAGKSLVLLDTQLLTQQLVPCSPSCTAVTALAVSSNRRLLAVAESGKGASVVVYTYEPGATPALRRRKVLQFADLGSTELISLDFSHDGRHLAALGGFPEWNVVYWSVERAKVVATCPALDNALAITDMRHLRQCSVSPHDAALVCVTGTATVRFYRMQDGRLQVSHGGVSDEGTHYLAHTWVPGEDGRLVVSTSNGDLLLFDKQEYKFPLPLSPSDGLSINALAAYSKGFVCGGDMGLITIFERTDSAEMYRKVRTFRFSEHDARSSGSVVATAALAAVASSGGGGGSAATAPGATAAMTARQPALTQQSSRVALSTAAASEVAVILAFTLTPPPAEEYLAFLTSTKQLYCLNLPNADFVKTDDAVFQPVAQPFHSGAVTSADMCAQRPLLVTAGRDRYVFLWNCLTNMVEMRKRFATEIMSVAIHPTGLYLLIGFADALRLMNVYDTDLCECKTISIRGCTACCFSSGGQFFAAMHSTTIHVYYTYTCELLGHLRGHSGKVRSLYFVPPDDTRLVSCGTDGAVFEYSLCDFHKVNDHVLKSVTYNCVSADVHTVWAAGSDRRLRQLERARLQTIAEYDLDNASMVSMAMSARLKLLFGGCEDGTVRVFNTYLGEKLHMHDKDNGSGGGDGAAVSGGVAAASPRSITIETHSTHTGAVSKLILSHDGGMLVSVGEDGVVAFWNVVAPHRGIAKEVEYSTELLVDRRALEATAGQLRELSMQVADLKQRMVQQQIKRERVHEEQIARLEREYSEQLAQQRARIAALAAEKNEQAMRFTEHMAALDQQHRETMQQTDADYSAKLTALRDRAEQLRRLIDERRAVHAREVAALQEAAAQQMASEQAEHETLLRALDAEQDALLQAREDDTAMTTRLCAIMEDDNETEMNAHKEHYETRRRAQTEEVATLQVQKENAAVREQRTRADLAAATRDVVAKLREQGALEAQMATARRDIDALTNELRERAETMAEKDRRIDDLASKNTELEKFRFVLEYKIRELQAQMAPRDAEIAAAKERLTHMESEMGQYAQSNEALELQIRNLRQKRAAQQRELAALQATRQAADAYQAHLWTLLSDAHDARDDARQLKRLAMVLYDTYARGGGGSAERRSAVVVTTAASASSRTAGDEVRDYHRERDHLERNLTSLKRKAAKDAENHRSDRGRIIAENVILVREINELRKEARVLAARAGVLRPTDPSGASVYDDEAAREVAAQQAEMRRLHELAQSLEAELQARGIPLPNPATLSC